MKLPKDKKIPVVINTEISLFKLIRRAVGIAIIVILATLLLNSRRELEEQIILQEAIHAELETWIDKDGVNRARIQSLETSNTKDFLKLTTKDSSIIALQKSVKSMEKYLKKQGSVTNFSTSTGIDTSAKTKVIENKVQPQFPIYWSDFNLQDKQGKSWVYGNSTATKDSTTLKLNVINDYSVTLGIEPTGFLGLGKGKPFGDVKNYNPYSVTEELRTYQVTIPKPKRFGVGPVVAYGFGTTSIKGQWFVGIGGSYQLIKF